MKLKNEKRRRHITSVCLFLLIIIALAVQLMGAQETKAETTYITYSRALYDNSGDSLLNLAGNASYKTDGLYITDNSIGVVGSAFFNNKIKSTDGFSTYFVFKLTSRTSWSGGTAAQAGADGIVFIVSSATNQYGSAGGSIGYAGVNNSVGIEFDSYKNAGSDKPWENSESHIAINVNGANVIDTEPEDYVLLEDDYFNADGPFYTWIDYDADTHNLEIRINTSNTRPETATLSTTINLASYAGEEYYVGFTSATGGSRENHFITKWLFSNTYKTEGLSGTGTYSMDSTPPTPPTLTLSGTNVEISGSTDTGGSGLAGYEYKLDSGDWTSGDIVSLSGLSAGTHTISARALDNVGNISSTTSGTYKIVSVSYSSNGGTGSATGGNYLEGTNVNLSAGTGIEREGYTLSGWNTQANGNGTHYDLGASITAPSNNLALYAKWTGNTYTVSFDADGGSVTPTTQTKQYGSTYGKAFDGTSDEALPTPTKEGHTFGGWWTGTGGTGSEVTNATTVATASNHTLYAKWTTNTYTVTLDAQGGSASPISQIKLFGSTYGKASDGTSDEALPTPTKDGQTFGGWWTGAGGTGTEVTDTTTVATASNHTLYAKWTTNTYTVTFDAQGGSVSPTTQTKQYGSTYGKASDGTSDEALPTPTKEGNTFVGWWTGAGGTGTEITNATAVATALSHTLYAMWTTNTYTVNFDAQGGSVLPTSQIKLFGSNYSKASDGTSDEALPIPTKEGYTFGGWWTGAGGTGTEITSATTVATALSHTLYAKWIANRYTITFNANGGSAVSAVTQDFDTVIGSSPMSAKTHYTFSGWYGDAALTLPVTFPYTVRQDATLYAKWTQNTHMVTFFSNSSVFTVTSAGSGLGITPPADPSRMGHSFGGWYKEPACVNVWDFDTDTITAQTYLYAKWTANSYTVRFRDWDGKLLKTQTVKYNDAAVAPSAPTRAGYSFTGWNFDYDQITQNMTVTAQYRISTYTVVFNTSGGSNVPAQTINYEGSAKKPENPSREGYEFEGWYTDSGFNKAYDFSDKVTADITLYAKFTKTTNAVQSLAQALTIDTAFKFAQGDTWECVTSDFMILRAGTSDVQIVWTSSNESAVRIEGGGSTVRGIVTRPKDRDVSVVITAEISKDGVTATKTFLLVIKREGASKNETREITERTATLKIGQTTGVDTIYRTVLNDGTNIDTVIVTPETVRKLVEQSGGAGTVEVNMDSHDADPANEFAFEVSADSVIALAEKGLGITLTSPQGSVTLSPDAVRQASENGMELYFRIVPVPDQADDAKQAMNSDKTVLSVINAHTMQVFGVPRIIETNMEGYATTVILPLEGLSAEQLADEAFLETLWIYVEHDDGTTEIIQGTLVYTDNVPTAIAFDISKYSRFQVVSVEQAAEGRTWIWIVTVASGILLLFLIILLATVRRRRRNAQMY